jgi:hypothetical protein
MVVGEGRATAERSVPRWWRGPDPDPVEVGRPYVQESRTETEIAVMMSVSRARVTAVLRDARIPRRDSRKSCPVDPGTLRGRVRAGATATSVARSTACPIRRRRGGWPRPACLPAIGGGYGVEASNSCRIVMNLTNAPGVLDASF